MVTEKPITNQQLPISKLFAELVLTEMPINTWCAERDRLNKNKKF